MIWFFIDSYLGHGRMLETALIFVKFQYAVIFLLIPADQIYFIAFSDFTHAKWVAIIARLTALLQSAGLWLNMRGSNFSRWFRLTGAALGLAIWTFMLIKSCLLGFWVTGLNPWIFMAALGSLMLIRKGLLNLPRPGALGAT